MLVFGVLTGYITLQVDLRFSSEVSISLVALKQSVPPSETHHRFAVRRFAATRFGATNW
jgi:hypothetical protein